MYLLTAAEMREADRYTIEQIGIPGLVLMENAGLAVTRAINERFQADRRRSVLVVCGKGNNGGDGFAIARHLFLGGDNVDVVLLGKEQELSGNAKQNMSIADNLGISITEVFNIADWQKEDINIGRYDLIVDAMLGTGIVKPIDGLFRYVVGEINASAAVVVAVDIPTGLPTDSGDLIGDAVQADLTVTFAYPKICHVLPPAETYCGDLAVADICIPDEAVKFEKGTRRLIVEDSLSGLLSPRRSDSHKGDYGHLLVVAGSMGKIGAGVMTARSASLSGVGLVTVAAPESCVSVVQNKLTEEMALPLPESKEKTIHASAIKKVLSFQEKATAMAIGPGIGMSDDTTRFVCDLVRDLKVPALIDADGLNALVGCTDILNKIDQPLILTPHPGELSRLTGMPTSEIQKDRIAAAARFAEKSGVYLVLKGYRTVVASPEGDVHICLAGNPGMATGGMGDVLAGIIGGLLAQGLEPIDAARLGVYIHGSAGDRAAESKGQISLVAGDIIDCLPATFSGLV